MNCGHCRREVPDAARCPDDPDDHFVMVELKPLTLEVGEIDATRDAIPVTASLGFRIMRCSKLPHV